MKASELIKRLKELIEEHGDLSVGESVLEDEAMSDIQHSEIFDMFFIV